MILFLGFFHILQICVSIFFVYAGIKLLYNKVKNEGWKSVGEDLLIMFVVVSLIYLISARIAETRMRKRVQRKIIKQDLNYGPRTPIVRKIHF